MNTLKITRTKQVVVCEDEYQLPYYFKVGDAMHKLISPNKCLSIYPDRMAIKLTDFDYSDCIAYEELVNNPLECIELSEQQFNEAFDGLINKLKNYDNA
jgi:hypothetical protein